MSAIAIRSLFLRTSTISSEITKITKAMIPEIAITEIAYVYKLEDKYSAIQKQLK